MIRINQIKLKPEQGTEALERKIRKLLRLPEKEMFRWQIVKSSVDARKKPDIYISYTVEVTGLEERTVMKRCRDKSVSLAEPVCYRFPQSGEKELHGRPVVVGTGPAGLFCGYMLALHGYRPILLERGQQVEERCRMVEAFWKSGVLDTECNVQFGEGGAGTFSDGKLNTLVKDKEGRNREVLRILVEAGAPEHILYEGKPHIGTDILVKVVQHMRRTILAHGGEVRFGTKMIKLRTKDGKVTGVQTEQVSGAGKIPEAEKISQAEAIETDIVVLAIGHSARDTFQMLYDSGVPMEAKAFAVGLRVEHPQKLINFSQYGAAEPEFLPPASYKLTAQTGGGRGVYSFCMCPGGYVVNASSEEGRLAVNGMSYSGRNGENSNSAVVVSVTPEDYGSSHPLGGLAFQRRLEERAYEAGGGKVPVERYGDFRRAVSGQEGGGEDGNGEWKIENFRPQMKGEWRFAPVHDILPEELNRAFLEGMEAFGKMIDGYASEQVLLSGVESRTSSPVRIHRDVSGQSEIKGLYPCGEGAGYAGGITSAAMDGIRIAELIAETYRPVQEDAAEPEGKEVQKNKTVQENRTVQGNREEQKNRKVQKSKDMQGNKRVRESGKMQGSKRVRESGKMQGSKRARESEKMRESRKEQESGAGNESRAGNRSKKKDGR